MIIIIIIIDSYSRPKREAGGAVHAEDLPRRLADALHLTDKMYIIVYK